MPYDLCADMCAFPPWLQHQGSTAELLSLGCGYDGTGGQGREEATVNEAKAYAEAHELWPCSILMEEWPPALH